MWTRKKLKKIPTIKDLMNIHNSIGMNDYFGQRIKKRLLPTLNYGKVNIKYNMDYYRKNYCCP